MFYLSPKKENAGAVQLSIRHKLLAFSNISYQSSPPMFKPMFSLTKDSSLLPQPGMIKYLGALTGLFFFLIFLNLVT